MDLHDEAYGHFAIPFFLCKLRLSFHAPFTDDSIVNFVHPSAAEWVTISCLCLISRPPSIWKIQPFHQSDSKKKWQLHRLKLPWHFLKWARLRCLCLVSVLPASHIPGQPESRPVMQDASYRRVIDGRALSQKEQDLSLKLTNTDMFSLQLS